MKKHLFKASIFAALYFASFQGTQAQNTVQRDAAGNFTTVSKVEAPKDSTTVFTYTDAKGSIYPVYVGSKGSLYVARTSKKTGNYYRQYLPKED
jgi:hypothetical protein